MAGLTAQQIVTLACQAAKTPGFTSQAGQLLNMILADLCQTYDFQVARRTFYFNFDTSAQAVTGSTTVGSGPVQLPANFLRADGPNACFYSILGVPYPLIPIDLSEFDMTVQQAGLQTYPYLLAIDMSPLDAVQQGAANGAPQGWVWPPPSGSYPVTLRYFCQMDDIDTPETSSTVPWFPNQNYLQTRLAGELMKIADDDRWARFLGDGDEGAQGILNRYLKMKDNKGDRAQSVTLDRRRFGSSGGYGALPNTKTVGW